MCRYIDERNFYSSCLTDKLARTTSYIPYNYGNQLQKYMMRNGVLFELLNLQLNGV